MIINRICIAPYAVFGRLLKVLSRDNNYYWELKFKRKKCLQSPLCYNTFINKVLINMLSVDDKII